MAQRNQLYDIDAAKADIENHNGPAGMSVDLVDGTTCRFRIKRYNGLNTYYGVTDDGKSVVMNVDTGQFDISD